MPQFVSKKVQRVRDNPDPDATIELVLGVAEDHLPAVKEWITEHGGEIKREAPYNLLLIELPETAIVDLCSQPGVESVDGNEPIGVLDGGNSHFPPR